MLDIVTVWSVSSVTTRFPPERVTASEKLTVTLISSSILKVPSEVVEVTDENGNTTLVSQNVTVNKSIPKVSQADIEYLDKQTGNFMVCQRGHQCVIEATVELYNVVSAYVEPPYLYQLTITCEWREWCDSDSTKNTSAGTRGEIQLTDAMQTLAQNSKMYSWNFDGKRYDIGTMKDWFQSHMELSANSEFSSVFREVINKL